MNTLSKEVEYQLHVTEFDWEIAPGKSIRAWGFNNQLPGPTLKASKGDRLIVKVKNNLHQPTIIHWHGIRLPAPMDGTGEVQPPIQPGEEFEYRFVVPDAGTFWYHSHFNETEQLERGMYGALIVEAESNLKTDNDRVFMIDDMKLTKENDFKKGGIIAEWIERHDGREGNTVLLNGKENPLIEMSAGQIERWRFINASSARYVQLHLNGRPYKVIGTDGGLIEKPVEEKTVLLTPGERLEILVGPFNAGEKFDIESLPYNRMTMLKAKREKFASVHVGDYKESFANIPEKLRHIHSLAQNAEITRKVKLSVKPSLKHIIDFAVNDKLHANDKPVRVGVLQVWEVSNVSLMDHPFHLHGFFFQVLEVNGKAPEYISWKDTVNLPPGSKVKIAWMPDDRPGIWMYHCHILEHHAAGMMANFEVLTKTGVATLNTRTHAHAHH